MNSNLAHQGFLGQHGSKTPAHQRKIGALKRRFSDKLRRLL